MTNSIWPIHVAKIRFTESQYFGELKVESGELKVELVIRAFTPVCQQLPTGSLTLTLSTGTGTPLRIIPWSWYRSEFREQVPSIRSTANSCFSFTPRKSSSELDLLLVINEKSQLGAGSCSLGDLARIQTWNLLIRSQMLYSVELRGQSGCKINT